MLTGFEPFHDNAVNPSQLIAERLNGETIGNARVVSLTLPVVFGEDTRRVFAAIDEWKPSVVISLGLSAGIGSIDVEMFAVNHRIADGSKALPPIAEDGPAAYFSTLPIDPICAAIEERAHLPVRRHGYAGSFLCNHILYQTLRHIETHKIDCRAGFLHLPQATENSAKGQPSLPLEQMIAGVRIAIEAAMSTP
ncbi:pyrrolidone-carboxylate peptidase [Capsulimonas corticalis]|uniref:Pyrrolidone-carboxylate peptidase n=1 Tax=Capsulimonas corticalis TaxID=2219043 RepID=A0A402D1S6_9BACT|nr:pyrrolidone-carboxylate peptidase [Capsulimonas corticalis]